MSQRAASSKRLADWPLWTAIGISLIAAALRMQPLGESLWLDELHTAWCAVGSLAEVPQRAAIGNQSPFFFAWEWLLAGLLGPSEISLRLTSFLAGSLLPLAVYWFAWRYCTAVIGLVAAALVALDPWGMFFGTEARPYALAQLMAVVHMAITVEIMRRPTKRLRTAWVLGGAILFYLHYTAILLLAAEIVFYGLVALLRPAWSTHRWQSAMIDCAILAILCLPVIGNLRSIFARRANWELFVERQPLLEALNWWPYPRVVSGGLLVVALAQFVWLVAARLIAQRTPKEKKLPEETHQPDPLVILALAISWVIVPLTVTWLATQTNFARLFFPRYLAVVFPGMALLAACLAGSLRPKWIRPIAGVLLIGLAAWPTIEQIRTDGRVIESRHENWRGCVAWLNQRLPQSGFPVLVFSGLIEADELRQPHDELLEDYCLSPLNSLYPLDVDRGDMFPLPLHEPGKLDQVAEMLVVHRGGAWLIVRADKKKATRIADEIAAHLRAAAVRGATAKWTVTQSESFGRVQALLLTTTANDPRGPTDPSVAGP